MGSKLLILDKDGTLVRPKSRAQFVQYPEDQELLPNVAETIARYAAEGWMMAIASNQGGVAKQTVKMSEIEPGHYICSHSSKVENIVDGWDDQGAYHRLILENGKRVEARANSLIEMQYKTLEDAIAEMRYCLKLLPQIERAVFCPDFDGDKLVQVFRNSGGTLFSEHDRKDKLPVNSKGFRKPSDGMIWVLRRRYRSFSRDCLIVGDRSEDEQAAQNAGIPFLWADAWRNGAEVIL